MKKKRKKNYICVFTHGLFVADAKISDISQRKKKKRTNKQEIAYWLNSSSGW
jgi:hypothetical protein